MNLSAILYLAALVTFLLALFGVQPGDVNLTLLGLSFVAGGLLAGSTSYGRIGD